MQSLQKQKLEVSFELRRASCELIAFNEISLVPEWRMLRDPKQNDVDLSQDDVTVWPRCSGTIELVSASSPSEL